MIKLGMLGKMVQVVVMILIMMTEDLVEIILVV